VKIGLKEGVVADLTGISLGVHFWPPGLEVPVGSGRLGIDPSVSYPPDPTIPDVHRWPRGEHVEHHYGAASIAMALSYDRVGDAREARGLSDRSMFGFRGNAVLGKTVGYAFGFDAAIGASAPLGFAYSAHLFPAGIGLVLGDTGFIGAYSGIGTSGASSTIRGALELPEELRLEFDLARVARIGLHGGVVVIPNADDRKSYETMFGATTRLGTRASGRTVGGPAGSGGFFFGLERRQIVNSFFLGASFGYELGVGG
jgi:hypothetical protein